VRLTLTGAFRCTAIPPDAEGLDAVIVPLPHTQLRIVQAINGVAVLHIVPSRSRGFFKVGHVYEIEVTQVTADP
jgi:hypothetical protein